MEAGTHIAWANTCEKKKYKMTKQKKPHWTNVSYKDNILFTRC